MKIYKIEIELWEGCDDFWNDIAKRNVTGCDEVLAAISCCLSDHGFFPNGPQEDNGNCNIKLIDYKDASK